jgi:hypothetical protein
VDEDVGETTSWPHGSTSEPCHFDVLEDAQSLCSFCDDHNLEDAVTTLWRRVRAEAFATDRRILALWYGLVPPQGGEANVVVRRFGDLWFG